MRRRTLLLKLLLPFVFIVFACSSFAIVLCSKYLRELPDVEKLENFTPLLTTRIYDVKGRIISELFVERRTFVSLQEIPPYLRQAMMAIEDHNFYSHWGLDFKGIMRATLHNFIAGRVVQGGSTITQQLAKTIFLSREKTLERKIKELLLTLQMERRFSKDEILQLYLNQIYFGNGAYGVQAAARTYFGKDLAELALEDCSLLAGLPRAPSYYSPFEHRARAVGRRNTVLKRMRQLKYITEKEEKAARSKDLGILALPSSLGRGSYFVDYIKKELEPEYGAGSLEGSGLNIYTTIDKDMQETAEQATRKHLENFDKRFKTETSTKQVQGALLALDVKTGAIRAMVGGRDFFTSQFNRATQAKRQPGSAFKPFVWVKALESGLTPAEVFYDSPVAYTDMETHPRLIADAPTKEEVQELTAAYPEDKIWAPENYDDKFLGPVTLRRALAKSRNLVAVRLIYRLGPEAVVECAHRAGILSKLEAVLSLSLGTNGVSLLELVSAFNSFVNNGLYAEPYIIERVTDSDSRILKEHVPRIRSAFTQQIAYLMVDMLAAVVSEGTGSSAQALARPAAGKTGTTQDGRDLWFVGFTPQLIAGCWIGYDDYTTLGDEIAGAGIAVPFWTDFMQEALKNVPVEQFPVPPGIVFNQIDTETGLLSTGNCPNTAFQAFIAGTEPVYTCNFHEEY